MMPCKKFAFCFLIFTSTFAPVYPGEIPAVFKAILELEKSTVHVSDVNAISVRLEIPAVGPTQLDCMVEVNMADRIHTIDATTIIIQIGTNLGNESLTAIPNLISRENDNMIDSVSFDFGLVTNLGASEIDRMENCITINFNVITLNISNPLSDTDYYIKASGTLGDDEDFDEEPVVFEIIKYLETGYVPFVITSEPSTTFFPGEVFLWNLTIQNLSDVSNRFRIKAEIPQKSIGHVKISRIFRVETGSAFSWFVNDYGNVVNINNDNELETPWIELINQDFLRETPAANNDFIVYTVATVVDESADSSIIHELQLSVENVNYGVHFSQTAQINIGDVTSVVPNTAAMFHAGAADTSRIPVGGNMIVKIDTRHVSSYDDQMKFNVYLPDTVGFAFLKAFIIGETIFEPVAIDAVEGYLSNGSPVTIADDTAVHKVVVSTTRTGSSAFLPRNATFLAVFRLLSTPTVNNNEELSIYSEAYYSGDATVVWNLQPVDINVVVCDDDPNSNVSVVTTRVEPALSDNIIYPWASQAFYAIVQVPDGKSIENGRLAITIPFDYYDFKPLFEIVSVELVDLHHQIALKLGQISIDNENGIAIVPIDIAYANRGLPTYELKFHCSFMTPYDYSNLNFDSIYKIEVVLSEEDRNCDLPGSKLSNTATFEVEFLEERVLEDGPLPPTPKVVLTPMTSTTLKKGQVAVYSLGATLPQNHSAWTEIKAALPENSLEKLAVSFITGNPNYDTKYWHLSYLRNEDSEIEWDVGNYIYGYTTNTNPKGPTTVDLGLLGIRLLYQSSDVEDETEYDFNAGLVSDFFPEWPIGNLKITSDTEKYVFEILPDGNFRNETASYAISSPGAAVYLLTVDTIPNSVGKYVFGFNVTRGASISSVVIINTGKNVPFLDYLDADIEVISEDGGLTNTSYMVTMIIGNNPRFDSIDSKADNQIQARIGVFIPPESTMLGSSTTPLTEGDTLQVAATVTIEDRLAYSGVLNSPVTLEPMAADYPETIEITTSHGDSNPYIGKSFFSEFFVKVKTNTTSIAVVKLNVTFGAGSDGESYGIVESFEKFSVGKNIYFADFGSMTKTSTGDNSQMNSAEIEFQMANSRAWSMMPNYEQLWKEEDDDSVTVLVKVRNTDHNENVRHVQRDVTITLTYNDGSELQETFALPPVRVRGNEAPQLETSWQAHFEPSAIAISNKFYVYGTVKHSENSTAHGHLVRLRFFLPQHLAGVDTGELISQDGTLATARIENNPRSVDLVWDKLLMEETAIFNISIVLDPTKTSGPDYHVMRLELSSSIEARKLQKNPSNPTEQIPIDEAHVTKQLYGDDGYMNGFSYRPPACSARLGMSDPTVITDCMIYASSTLETFNGRDLISKGTPGRLGSSYEAWMPVPRGEPFISNEYVMVSIGASATISGLEIQGDAGDVQQAVSEVELQWSLDGLRWMTYVDKLTNSPALNISWQEPRQEHDISFVLIDPPIRGASYVKIIPKRSIASPTTPFVPLRFELRGCAPVERDQKCLNESITTPTPRAPNTPSEYAPRAYLWVDTDKALYVCSQRSIE